MNRFKIILLLIGIGFCNIAKPQSTHTIPYDKIKNFLNKHFTEWENTINKAETYDTVAIAKYETIYYQAVGIYANPIFNSENKEAQYSYDKNAETFRIKFQSFPDIYLKVPLTELTKWAQTDEITFYNTKFSIANQRFFIVSTQVMVPNKNNKYQYFRYSYDITQDYIHNNEPIKSIYQPSIAYTPQGYKKQLISLQSNDSSDYNNSNQKNSDGFVNSLPPILTIQEITFSKNLLNAGEKALLSITLKNIGPGDANGVFTNLACDLTGLQFPAKTEFPTIEKGGGTKTVTIEITSGLDLPTSTAVMKIEIIEPNFKVKIQGKQIKLPTFEYLKPELLLAKFAVVENLSSNPNNQIDINEQIDVKFAIQNIGQGIAEDISINIENNQAGVMLLGVVDNSGNLIRKNPSLNSIASGKFETITYRYFVNSEFTSNQLSFTINATEKNKKYGFNQIKSVEINKILQEEGYIRTIASIDNRVKNEIIIEDIPDFISDVDNNIPVNTVINDKTFAVVIGNELYAKEIKVKFALNDARIFKQYLQKTLGLPNNNIHYIENGTFGQMLDALKWINDVIRAYKGNAKVIFYYAGHGMPDELSKSAYLLPVDDNSQNPATAVKLADVYEKLTEYQSISVTVFLDACFSGAAREQDNMLADGRGIKIKPKNDLLKGNIVVLSAATGDETAFPYIEKQHGIFTYFLLKKLKDSKGEVNLNELSNFVITNVTQQSVVINKKSQTPQVNTGAQVQNTWHQNKLK